MLSVSLAEKAQGSLEAGNFGQALDYLRQAILTAEADVGSLPTGENGLPDRSWLAYWEGACMVLGLTAAWRQTVFVVPWGPMHSLFDLFRALVQLHCAYLKAVFRSHHL